MNNLSEKIQDIIKSFVDKGQTAGANVLVFKDGKEIAYADFGYRDLENKTPFTRDTIFRLYSQTKPITAAATILLASRGQLDLGAYLSDYFPEYGTMYVNDKNGLRQAEKPIYVQDLLNMSAGLAYPDDRFEGGKQSGALFDEIDKRLYTENPMTTLEFADRASKLNLVFEPGTHFLYGICADILGALIEKITGQTYGQFLRENFFYPMEMRDTDFYIDSSKKDRLAKAYRFSEKGLEEYVTNHLGNIYQRDRQPAFESGGAGLVSTVDDYMKFATMLIQDGNFGGKKIMGKNAVAFLTKGGPKNLSSDLAQTFTWMKGYTYGNLMRVATDYQESPLVGGDGEYGWDGWMGSFFSNDSKNKISLVMGTQLPGVYQMGSMARQIFNLVHGLN